MAELQRVLLVSSVPRAVNLGIVDGLRHSFLKRGIDMDVVLYSDCRTLFDRFIIHTTNKWLHNLRLQSKDKNKFRHHPLSNKNYFESTIEKKLENYSPDIVLLFRGIKYSPNILKTIRGGYKLYGWWLQGEEACAAEVLDEIQLFDWYFFISSQCVEMMKEKNVFHTSYQNHVVNLDIFQSKTQLPLRAADVYDVCFVGHWSEKRQLFIEAALKLTKNIAIYGSYWVTKNRTNFSVLKCVKGRFVYGDALVSLYRKSLVVLNVTNWGDSNNKKRSGMNMRVLEVPACGAFLLTDTSIEMNDFLTPGVHIGTYETLDEFQSKLAYFLEHPNECKQIAYQGMQHIKERNIGYDQFVNNIIDIFSRQEYSI